MLVKHLHGNPNVACVAHCESTSTFKSVEHQMKSVGTTKIMDDVVDVCEFPEEGIDKSICVASYNQDHASMFDDGTSYCNLTETSWVRKFQRDRILRKPYSLVVETASEINNQDRPIG